MNLWTLIIHILVSAIIIACITRFVWKPTSKFIDKNKKKLDKEHRDLILYNRETQYYLKTLKEEKEKLAEIRKSEIELINKKSDQLMYDTKKEAERVSKEIYEAAQDRVKLLEEQAKEEIKNSVVTLSLELAEKLLRSKISKENSKQIIDDYIDELEKRDISSQKFS